MSTPEEPARLLSDSSGASGELRRALAAARGDLPSPDHVEALLARFPFPDGGGGGGGDTGGDSGGAPEVGGSGDVAAGAATKSAAIGKWLGGAVLAGSAGVALLAHYTAPPQPVEPAISAVVVAAASTTAAPVMSAPPSVQPSASEPLIASASASSVTRSLPATASATASASAASEPVRPEIEILKEAHASRANPGRMLELVNEHARSHPKGALGQEREMLRVEALVGLGKTGEAKALADAFRKGNPNSAYNERLNQIAPP